MVAVKELELIQRNYRAGGFSGDKQYFTTSAQPSVEVTGPLGCCEDFT